MIWRSRLRIAWCSSGETGSFFATGLVPRQRLVFEPPEPIAPSEGPEEPHRITNASRCCGLYSGQEGQSTGTGWVRAHLRVPVRIHRRAVSHPPGPPQVTERDLGCGPEILDPGVDLLLKEPCVEHAARSGGLHAAFRKTLNTRMALLGPVSTG